MNGIAAWRMRRRLRRIGLGAMLLLVLGVGGASAQPLVDAQAATRAAIERLRFAQENFPAAAEDLEAILVRLERSQVGVDGEPLVTDSCHLQATPRGLTAWIEARQAVLQIELLLDQAGRNNPRLPLAPALESILLEVEATIVGTYQFLADVALEEARAFADDASAAAQLEIAERQLEQARGEIAAGELEQAMQALRQVWEHAQKVVPASSGGPENTRLSIQQPVDGAVLFASPIDVAGMVQMLTPGTVGSDDVAVSVNGVPAEVVHRSFVARDVPLSGGLNALVGVARTSGGGVATSCVAVFLDTALRPRITAVSGVGQTAEIRTVLPQPLGVEVTDASGSPVAGVAVVFRVTTGDGTLDGGLRAQVVPTDAQGRAAIGFTLGSRAGVAVNRVRATAVGFPGEVIFAPTSTAITAATINAVSGDNQRGAVGAPLAEPLIVVVTDAGQNPVEGAPVVFEVLAGGGTVAGGAQAVVETDGDGRAAVEWTLGSEPGLDANRVEARFTGLANEPASFKASGFVIGDPAATRLAGVVLDNQGDPVPGVTLSVAGTDLATTADAEGQFLLEGVPVGDVVLHADAATTTRPGVWASLSFDLHTLPGITNTLEKPIYILPLDVGNGKIAGGAEDVTLEVPEVPGFSLTILAGSATFPDGSPTGLVSVTPVHADKIPMAPGSGMQPRFIVTVQPAGAHFDPPAPVTFPNVDGLPPGTVTEMFSFDHDLGEFVSIGTGTVSEDGTVVASDPGFGIVKAGWHCSAPQSGSGAGASLQVDITTDDPVILAAGQTPPDEEPIEATGGPPRDAEYTWEIADPAIATLNPSGSGLCPGSTSCNTTATAGDPGETTATVTILCTTTNQSDQDQIQVLVVAATVEELISEQLAGRECNKLPPPAHAGKNNPMLMGARSGNRAAVSLKTQIDPAKAANRVRVGVRRRGTTAFLGDEQAKAFPGKAVVEFDASPGLNLYEGVVGLDKNDDGMLQDEEVVETFPDPVRVVTASDQTSAVSTVESQDIFLIGTAQDLVDVFLDKLVAPPGATSAGSRTIASTLPTHPLGASWGGSCSASVTDFRFGPTSDIAMEVSETSRVEGFVKAELTKHKADVQAFFANPSSPPTAVFPAALGQGPWAWSGSVGFGGWLGDLEIEIAGAFGSVSFNGTITEVEVEKGSLNVLRIVYRGGFEDLYDFDFTDSNTRAAATVQAGFPTLGGAGEIFFSEVEFEREAFRTILGGFRFTFQ